jgi:hypothetical protein
MLVLWTLTPSDSSYSLSVPSIAEAIATTLGPGTGGFALAITDRSVPVRPFGVIWAGGTWHTILLGTDDRDDVVAWYIQPGMQYATYPSMLVYGLPNMSGIQVVTRHMYHVWHLIWASTT